jgi:hypothetical protein
MPGNKSFLYQAVASRSRKMKDLGTTISFRINIKLPIFVKNGEPVTTCPQNE